MSFPIGIHNSSSNSSTVGKRETGVPYLNYTAVSSCWKGLEKNREKEAFFSTYPYSALLFPSQYPHFPTLFHRFSTLLFPQCGENCGKDGFILDKPFFSTRSWKNSLCYPLPDRLARIADKLVCISSDSLACRSIFSTACITLV